MRVRLVSHNFAGNVREFIPAKLRIDGHALPAMALAAALCGAALSGCSSSSTEGEVSARSLTKSAAAYSGRAHVSIPLPDHALLEAQPAPKCEFKSAGGKTDKGGDTALMKLDFERQCYRHAEILARQRLGLLQASVDQTIKAVQRNKQVTW